MCPPCTDPGRTSLRRREAHAQRPGHASSACTNHLAAWADVDAARVGNAERGAEAAVAVVIAGRVCRANAAGRTAGSAQVGRREAATSPHVRGRTVAGGKATSRAHVSPNASLAVPFGEGRG